MKRKNATRPEVEFRTTYLGSTCIRKLGAHALELPVGTPARAIITGLIRRWMNDGRPVGFEPTDDGYVLTREQAAALVRGRDTSEEIVLGLVQHFDLTDEDVLGVEAVMAA